MSEDEDVRPNVTRAGAGELPEQPPAAAGAIVIANEFADVVVSKVETRNGMRLAICSPRRGTTVLLDAVALDCLSFQPPELITELLTRNPGQ